jgi:ribosomal protein S18 acetylase RimI-like enzyme
VCVLCARQCIIAELSSVFGCDQISLDVKSDNYPAIALYLKSKFVVESHSPNYYFFGGRYHDAFHMVLDLQSDEAVEDAKPAVGGHSFCVVL